MPTITLEGDANGAPHPPPSAYAKRFGGPYSHRRITGGIGHNLPHEAPEAFVQAIKTSTVLICATFSISAYWNDDEFEAPRPPRDLPPVDRRDHIIGPHEAAVTLVEYGDFQCPNCRQAAPALKLMLGRYSECVRLVYRHFPLREVHPLAQRAAEASEAAAAQDRFWAMHDAIFNSAEPMSADSLRAAAEACGVDLVRYDFELASGTYAPKVNEHIAGAQVCGVRATPTIFLNGSLEDVSFGFDRLLQAVDEAVAISAIRGRSTNPRDSCRD